VITGRVLSPEHTPITADCSINLFSVRGGFISSAVVDGNGRYTFAGLGSGEHLLGVSYFGSQNWLDEYYEDALSQESATPVQVHDPDTTHNIDFRLNLGAVISGEVVNPGGQPVPEEVFWCRACRAALTSFLQDTLGQRVMHIPGIPMPPRIHMPRPSP
jgi:hypothetical protein